MVFEIMMEKPLRVMWLLNHTTARRFEVAMLKRLGVQEIFMPKIFPADPNFRSASVDWSEDAGLTIPASDLALINETNWCAAISVAAWQVANKHFDIIFCIPHNFSVLAQAAKYFHGAVICRAYGLPQPSNYSAMIGLVSKDQGVHAIRTLGRRFFFGVAYSHLTDSEDGFLASRHCFLPLGMGNAVLNDVWRGDENRILFVCPDIGVTDYYKKIYEKFITDFDGLPYVIAGAQPIMPDDEHVLGFVSADQHEQNMQSLRLMFYHSQEPNHIHYHPFEAVRAGMPLLFMAGGMLDRLGGRDLPGRCLSVQDARQKAERMLNGDSALVQRIRASQQVLLDAMKPENCEQAWRDGWQAITGELAAARAERACRPARRTRTRIAVILPVAYRGGSLRGIKLLAQALHEGSRQYQEAADIVLLYPDDGERPVQEMVSDLAPGIQYRTFRWKTLAADEARRAMRYAGHEAWEPDAAQYQVPDDGIRQLLDCDLWLVVSDRLSMPLLPVRPSMLMVYDYLQRYVPILPHGADQPFLDAARCAERVLVTTEFTRQDALQYAGVAAHKVCRVPMLVPDFSGAVPAPASHGVDYFVWTTNAALHKNHQHALAALNIYYEELDGRLDCLVTGVDSRRVAGLLSGQRHQARAALDAHVHWLGELPDRSYRQCLAGARFLWHAASMDNGPFAVVEAAYLGVPALSSDYPAMREMDARFALQMAWMDASSPEDMAGQLKKMEQTAITMREVLPAVCQLQQQHVGNLAGEYWKVVRECL